MNCLQISSKQFSVYIITLKNYFFNRFAVISDFFLLNYVRFWFQKNVIVYKPTPI